MRKTRLWWGAAITGVLSEALPILSVSRLWGRLEPDDRYLGVVLGLLPFVWIGIGWKRPLAAGFLFIAEALLLWGWAVVEVFTIGNLTGHYEFPALLSVAILRLPLLVAGVLFLLAGRKSQATVKAG